MNTNLWNAHLEAVNLRKQIQDLRQQLRARPARQRCVYCGTPTRGVTRACPAHADLPRLDPGYHA